MKPQFLIAAPASNAGKTTLTLGLLRLLYNRGFKVQPFKCGPDFIDTKHHSLAAHATGINLDTFMMTEGHLCAQYAKYGAVADVVITEGVMGLFDGAERMKGSSAEIATLLDLPVILVIDAGAMAYSVAPLIYGFKHFNPQVRIAGVIFNFVGGESHYRFLRDACEDLGVAPLGYMSANDDVKIPSRHLGLAISPEKDYDVVVERIATHISQTVDIEQLLTVTLKPSPAVPVQTGVPPLRKMKIAVARDDAFNFTYAANQAMLEQLGKVTFFSPLADKQLPQADLLYLAGGYPELFSEKLVANEAMRQSVFAYCQHGGKVIAECGGMMYLGQTLADSAGEEYPMVDFLGIKTTLKDARLSLGYREVEIGVNRFRGHEFHYSVCQETEPLPRIGKVFNARGETVPAPIYRKNGVVASYLHIYWGEDPAWLCLFS